MIDQVTAKVAEAGECITARGALALRKCNYTSICSVVLEPGQEQTKDGQQLCNENHEHATSWCAFANSKVEICQNSTSPIPRPLPNQEGADLQVGKDRK